MSGRGRFLLAAALIVGLPLSLFLLWTEVGLRPALEREYAGQLARGLRLAAAGIEANNQLTDPLADDLGDVMGLRVSFIAADGRVLGDSEVEPERLGELDDHSTRPEVAAARATGLGYSLRRSRTLALPLFYVAIPHRDDVIRAAIPAAELTALMSRTRRTGIFFSLLVLGLLYLLRRPLGLESVPGADRIREVVRRMGRGDLERPVPVIGGPLQVVADELTETARSLSRERAERDAHLARFEAMLDAIEDGVAVCDGDGTVLQANRAFQRWSGRPEMIGSSVGTLFRNPVPREIVETALAGDAARAETTLGTRTAEVRSAPLGPGALLVLRDLTATRRLEGMRRDFVANVSHELKTPLTAIRGFAEPLLEADMDPEQGRAFLSRILANVERMQLLVDDLLDLTRIESGGWSPERRHVDFRETVEAVWGRMEPLATARRVRLTVEADADFEILADPPALQQILANLLDNAIRYSPEGDVVTVRAEREGRDAVVTVSDRGPGIPSEHVERVFERFYRVDSGRSRAAGGTGLGLAIVKHLAVAQGGSVGLDSELGVGTTVWIRLPPDLREPAAST